MRTRSDLLLVAIVALFPLSACGGGQGEKTDPIKDQSADPVGDGDGDGDGSATPMGDGDMAGDGDGDGTGDGSGDGSGTGDGDGDGDGNGATPPPAGPPVTIKIKNSWTKELEFNLTLGWGSRIQMYSGQPPKAKAIEPFARACTASCSAPEGDRCPVCKKPTSLGEIRKEQEANTVVVMPGKEHVVTWNAKAHGYKKGKDGRRSCKCFEEVDPPAETYTIRVCGLRLSKKHRQKSTLQCVTKEGALTLPVDGPQVFVFDFGDPNAKPAKKKKP